MPNNSLKQRTRHIKLWFSCTTRTRFFTTRTSKMSKGESAQMLEQLGLHKRSMKANGALIIGNTALRMGSTN